MVSVRRPNLFIKILSRPEGFLAVTFAAVILVGGFVLSLPICHGRAAVHPLDAFFTSTSAVCVTGLVVLDIGKDYNLLGQVVIMLLIQIGGLGIMTFTALAIRFVGLKVSLRSQVALHDTFYQRNAAAQFHADLRWIVLLTFVIEAMGAAVMALALPADQSWSSRIYISAFHAVSAFCNAGFSTYSGNLADVRGNIPFVAAIAILIILGGLGYTVLLEVVHRCLRNPGGPRCHLAWSLNTRVVLVTSAMLILGGMVAITASGLSVNEKDFSSRLGNALFQSISARTAGFNTIDCGAIPVASLLWLVLLMFVGGSPGSCAGGVKTTSLAVWMARLWARIRQRADVTIGKRRIPVELVRRTGLLVGIAGVFNIVGVMILSLTELSDTRWRLEHILFEQISAFGTVGLSAGITPYLTVIGKLWIMLTMFVGRVGPLTVALLVLESRTDNVRLPEERIMIG